MNLPETPQLQRPRKGNLLASGKVLLNYRHPNRRRLRFQHEEEVILKDKRISLLSLRERERG